MEQKKEMAIIWRGTVAPLSISLEAPDGQSMDEYDFSVEFYTSAYKPLTLTKESAIRQGENSYLFLVNTSEIGTGRLECRVTAKLPYPGTPDGFRLEVLKLTTDYIILQ